jgi:acyl-CoA thioesterase FadM
MAPYEASYPVRFGEIDHAGVMYYPAIFDRIHRAFEDFWPRTTGRDLAALIEEGVGLPVREVKARFLQPFRFGETVRIEIGVLSIGGSSLVFRCRLFGDGGPPHRVEAVLTNVTVDMTTFRPVDVPGFMRTALTPLLLEGSPD